MLCGDPSLSHYSPAAESMGNGTRWGEAWLGAPEAGPMRKLGFPGSVGREGGDSSLCSLLAPGLQ